MSKNIKNIDFSKGSIIYSLKDDEKIEFDKGSIFIEDEEYVQLPKFSKKNFGEISVTLETPIVDFREWISLSYLKSCIDDYKPRIKRWKP